MELNQIKNHGKFKARKLSKKLFSGTIGVTKVERIPATTQFQEFKLQIASKPTVPTTKTSEELELEECKKNQFKARELNRSILAPKSIERKSAPA